VRHPFGSTCDFWKKPPDILRESKLNATRAQFIK